MPFGGFTLPIVPPSNETWRRSLDGSIHGPNRQKISNCSLLKHLRAFFAWAYDSYNDSLIISGGSNSNKTIRSSDSGETFHALADVPAAASQGACGVMVDNNTYLHIGGLSGGVHNDHIPNTIVTKLHDY